MEQTTINQRLKILVDSLNLSSRAFSEIIGESPTNTHNYIGSRQAEPRAGYLMKVLSHFNNISPTWLMTGQGEPFIGEAPATQSTSTRIKKNNQSPIITNNHGPITYSLADCVKERDTLKTQFDQAQIEIQSLRQQLERADALVASKEETISLLRATYNRPN